MSVSCWLGPSIPQCSKEDAGKSERETPTPRKKKTQARKSTERVRDVRHKHRNTKYSTNNSNHQINVQSNSHKHGRWEAYSVMYPSLSPGQPLTPKEQTLSIDIFAHGVCVLACVEVCESLCCLDL